MKYFKKLVGERIYLSPRNAEDVEQFTEWMNDFEVTDYIGRTAQMISLSGEKEFLEKNANPESTFVIVDLKDDVMVGTVSLEKIDRTDSKATLGIFIGDVEEREKGYGTEAINLILDYGFNYLNLNNIKLDVVMKEQKHVIKNVDLKNVVEEENANLLMEIITIESVWIF